MSRKFTYAVVLLILALVVAACRQEPEVEPTEAPAAEATEAPAEEPTEEPADEPTEEPMEEATEEPMEEDMGPIKIGFMGPLTGGAAFIGVEQLGFAKVAVQIFTEETGIEIEIVEGDTEINADTGRIVAERFVADEEIIGVVGPAGSQVCESTQPVFEEAGLAHITPSCTNTALTQPGTATFFRPIPTDADHSQTVADYMINTFGVETVYMVDDQSSYSVGLDDELTVLLEDAGVTVDRASVTQEETDFSSIATAAIAAGADAIFFPSQIESQEGTLAVQLREQGYDGVYFLADGGFSLGWVEVAGDASEGTYVTFFSPDPNLVPEAAPYNALYAEQFSEEFGAFVGKDRVTTEILLWAIDHCNMGDGVSRECIQSALVDIDLDNTMLGLPISFGEGNQAAGSSFFLFQVQDGAFALLAEGETGIAAGPEPLEVDVPIKVGFMGPLTGGAAFIGVEQLGFAQVTIDAFNERFGTDIQIEEGDTEINADTGRIVAERFVADEDIYIVVGPAGSQVCESTQPVFEDAGLAHITPSCTNTALTQPGTPTFFRPIPTDADQSQTVADFMIDELGVSSVYMVDDQSSYSVGLDDELTVLLEDAGVTVDRASVTQEETDFSSIATAAIASGADAVFFPSQIESQEGTLAVQLQEQGYEGVYFLADGGFSLGWVEVAGDASEGTYVTFFAPDPNLVPTMAPYNERYAAEYSEEFGAFGGAAGFTTFIALDALETCIRAGDVSKECVVEALANVDLATTPLGVPVSFGEGNQAEGSSFFLFQVQDGAFELLQ